jgi:hypothetical protein
MGFGKFAKIHKVWRLYRWHGNSFDGNGKLAGFVFGGYIGGMETVLTEMANLPDSCLEAI